MIYKFSRQKYIFILLCSGLLLTLFLVPISKVLSDGPVINCKDFSYSIKNECLSSGVYTFSFENKNNYDLVLEFSEDTKKYFIGSNSKVNIRFENFSNENRELFTLKKVKNDYLVCSTYDLREDFLGGC